ncbi:MAG: DUF1403 family protein [Thalassovita sp.]|jgi:hypothetical protein
MAPVVPPVDDAALPWPRLPAWAIRRDMSGHDPEDLALIAGAALSMLHYVLTRNDLPLALWLDRLALRAAEATVTHSGRPERASDLRDAVHLLRPGDHPGPAGGIFVQWRWAVGGARQSLSRAVPDQTPDRIAAWLDTGPGNPVACAARVLETVLTEVPHAEADALILADTALAQALGWDHTVPLLAVSLPTRALRLREDDLRLACYRALPVTVAQTMQMAADLSRRAAHLRHVAPKLRSKGAGAAVQMVLTRDAIAPAALTSIMSDRAARRFCDRLVTLGVARELTGRDTFRLYGV